MLLDMETQIHILEQEAYCAVLRAFKAQADAITWDKEALITELRKELRVNDDEHRELLARVNGDDIIQQIRKWRQSIGNQVVRYGASQISQDAVPSPTVSGSRKKQKTSLGIVQNQPFSGLSSVKTKRYPPAVSSVNRHFPSFGNSGSLLGSEHVDVSSPDALIGRKLWTRWPEDNNFYGAVITGYNPSEGRHALVYDADTANETCEWVDLKEIPEDDLRWEGNDLSHHNIYGGSGPNRAVRKPIPGGGRGKGRGPRREFTAAQNGLTTTKHAEDIELLNTDALVEEVGRLCVASQPDPFELDKAKKMLKEHEQALVDAIARLADASDNESDQMDNNCEVTLI